MSSTVITTPTATRKPAKNRCWRHIWSAYKIGWRTRPFGLGCLELKTSLIIPAEPTPTRFHGAAPPFLQRVGLVARHLRCEFAIELPQAGQVGVVPQPRAEAREVRRTERRGLGQLRPAHRNAEEVRLQLAHDVHHR